MLNLTDQIFEKVFTTLTGRKLSHGIFIISVFIQGRNACNFSLIWKHYFVQILIAMANDLLKNCADSFISFDGILPKLVDFLL